MSGQVITIRGDVSECWFISRASDDQYQPPSVAEDWFALMDAPWVISYQSFSSGTLSNLQLPTSLPVPYQFVLRRSPVTC